MASAMTSVSVSPLARIGFKVLTVTGHSETVAGKVKLWIDEMLEASRE
jgi:hypothetical protein